MALPSLHPEMSKSEIDEVVQSATDAASFLKAISHEGRLMILCHLVSGEKSVTELEELLASRQAAVSQQLSRLRLEGLVVPRRDGKTIYYRLADDRPKRVLEVVYDIFCTAPLAEQTHADS
ncbi:MAG: metalloregulator ArsR/SmtB family transcription factor [Paracoccaceae bacterium]